MVLASELCSDHKYAVLIIQVITLYLFLFI